MTGAIRVHPFDAHDLPWVQVQDAQADEWRMPEDQLVARGRVVAVFDHSYTIRDAGGTILCCIGLIPNHARNFTAWSVLSVHAGPYLTALTHWGRRYIDRLQFDRIDMQVRADFENGHRWARALYFAVEGTRDRWYADGCALISYVRFGEAHNGTA